MHMRIIPTLALVALLGSSTLVRAQQREEPLPFGNMDQWVKREIKESAIIGGELKNIYADRRFPLGDIERHGQGRRHRQDQLIGLPRGTW